jgi:amidohydrolase
MSKINAMDELVRLRHELHRNPELSGNERATAKRLRFFLSRYQPHELYSDVAGHGMAVVYRGKEPGPTVLFRCDMDALPINEQSGVPYSSNTPNVSHTCGHDGHMAIVSGLAVRLFNNPLSKGKVVLLYQPSEENGTGAKASIEKLREFDLFPDYAIAIHNMPKYKLGSVILGRYTFTAASKGLIIKLQGRNSHAAFPELGLNPAGATAEIIQHLLSLSSTNTFKDFVLVTLIHVKVGDVAFGTSPGSAVIMATLRAFDDSDMEKLSDAAIDNAVKIALKHGLAIETNFTDDFPASVCNPELTHTVEQLARKNNRDVIYLEEPNRWSEDFANFTSVCPSIIFGLGSGENQPDIHTPNFDFPDELIGDGVDLLEAIVRELTLR